MAIVTNTTNIFFHAFILPFQKGLEEIELACTQKTAKIAAAALHNRPAPTTLDFSERVVHFLAGAALMIPIVNIICFVTFSHFGLFSKPANSSPHIRITAPVHLHASRRIRHPGPAAVTLPPPLHTTSTTPNRSVVSVPSVPPSALAARPRKLPFGSAAGCKSFFDRDIIWVHPLVPSMERCLAHPGHRDYGIHYTTEGKAVILQGGPEGCSAAAAGMLIADHNRDPSPSTMRSRTIADYRAIADDISAAGLSYKLTQVTTLGRSLVDLRDLLLRHGPAIVRIKEHLVGHFVVVDKIEGDAVTIRDPFHGWCIDVRHDVFLRAWMQAVDDCNTDYVIQISS